MTWTSLYKKSLTNMTTPKLVASAVVGIALMSVTVWTTSLIELSPGSSGSGGRLLQDNPPTPNSSEQRLYVLFYNVVQFVAGVVFWFSVGSKYRAVEAPTELSAQHMGHNAVTETCDSCCQPVCWMSYCCPFARWALTLHATDILNYWAALVLGVCCYPCLVCGATAFSDLNVKLGGTATNCCEACLCAWFVRAV